MNIKPISDRIVVEPIENEKVTASGIIIPDSAKGKPVKGNVLAVGPGKSGEKMQVEVGNVVLYSPNVGTTIEHEGKKVLLMREVDVFAVI